MLAIGLSLKWAQIEGVFRSPIHLIAGLTLQLLALPALALAWANLFDLPAEIQVGLVILAACPGGTTSNFITYMFDGDTPLSISLTATNSVIALISIPFVVNLGIHHFLGTTSAFSLPVMDTMLRIFLVTILPVGIGLLIRSHFPNMAAILDSKLPLSDLFGRPLALPIMKSVTVFLLGAVFAIKFFGSEATIAPEDIQSLLPMCVSFNLLVMLLGWLAAHLLQFPGPTKMTVGLEVGLQNTTLAFLVAGTLLGNDAMQQPALVYALFTFWSALSFAILTSGLMRKKSSRRAQSV